MEASCSLGLLNLILPLLSKRDPSPRSPERASLWPPSPGSYFSFMIECAKWETDDMDFQIFRPQQSDSHRIFALTTGFSASPDSNFSLQQACHKFVMTRVQVCHKFVMTSVQACSKLAAS
ncbi:hypothetical protein AVEN_181306-1 [Araneus ventricosus]|uniref:Uncharacterized protein n=1 Tax=Araneus ventricosus TaxID=182803 RepID=A0A4Y2EGG2_ARAVE|nr:hypothetical protein AVEN_181306-1 [Araneus ventricosus]